MCEFVCGLIHVFFQYQKVVDQSIEPYLTNARSSAEKRNLLVVNYTSLIFKIYILQVHTVRLVRNGHCSMNV